MPKILAVVSQKATFELRDAFKKIAGLPEVAGLDVVTSAALAAQNLSLRTSPDYALVLIDEAFLFGGSGEQDLIKTIQAKTPQDNDRAYLLLTQKECRHPLDDFDNPDHPTVFSMSMAAFIESMREQATKNPVAKILTAKQVRPNLPNLIQATAHQTRAP